MAVAIMAVPVVFVSVAGGVGSRYSQGRRSRSSGYAGRSCSEGMHLGLCGVAGCQLASHMV